MGRALMSQRQPESGGIGANSVSKSLNSRSMSVLIRAQQQHIADSVNSGLNQKKMNKSQTFQKSERKKRKFEKLESYEP